MYLVLVVAFVVSVFRFHVLMYNFFLNIYHVKIFISRNIYYYLMILLLKILDDIVRYYLSIYGGIVRKA